MPLQFSVRRAAFLRTFTFGVEDSLVSTAGLITGIAVGGLDRNQILLAGVVLIFVEAFSMGVGSYLSERSSEEFRQSRNVPMLSTLPIAGLMFASYFFTGVLTLFPYLFFPLGPAILISIVCTMLALFGLGVLTGKISGRNGLRKGFEMLLIGGVAIAIGVVIGSWMRG